MRSFDWFAEGPRLNAAEIKAEAAQDRSERLQFEVNELKRRCDALTIGCQAMWELLREACEVGDEAIVEKIKEIDLRDGVEDGKITVAESKQCPNCGRATNARRQACLYCGTPLPPAPGESVFNRR